MEPSHGQKRAADFSPTAATHPTCLPGIIPAQGTTPPRILRRHHHRRRPIATTLWPTEPAPAPSNTASHPSPPFNIYKSLLRHPNLFFQFTIRLPHPLLLTLYTIDKEFHYRLNKYSVGILHEYALYHAPEASRIFAWSLFPEVCISDPMLRPMDGRAWLARDVPGLRWVGMVLFRQGVVRGILTQMGVRGQRVPRGAFGVLCKFWCVMKRRTGVERGAFVRDEGIWSAEEIGVMLMLLVKLDMCFSDAVVGNGGGELSRLLLAQRGLGMLYRVLKGEVEMDYDAVTDLLVRTYLSEDLDTDTHPWLDDEIDNGVPEEEWGLLSREGWHMDGKKMESAVDMVIMEGIRRGLDVHKYYLDFVLYGFVDGEGNNVPVPRALRQGSGAKVVEMGWPSEQARHRALSSLKNLAEASCSDKMDMGD